SGYVPAGRSAFVNFTTLENALREAQGRDFDSTQLRVSISLLERVGLIRRHPDTPRTALLKVLSESRKAEDERFAQLIRILNAPGGQQMRYEMVWLSREMGVTVSEIDLLLLDWQENGLISYTGERRDPVIERLPAPGGVAADIDRFLEERDRVQQLQAEQMISYATREECRHVTLAAHLGEKIIPCEESCDYCNPDPDKVLPTTANAPELPRNTGQVIVECLESFPFNAGRPSLVKALTGSAASNISSERVKHFGALAAASPSSISKAIDELTAQGYIRSYEDGDFRLLEVTRKGSDGVPDDAVSLKQKSAPRAGARPGTPKSRSRSMAQPETQERAPTPEESAVFERLRAWRRTTASAENLPPYVIFHDRTLWAIARAMPSSASELTRVSGIGSAKIERYGEDILAMVNPPLGEDC
ncbi:MAG TPA: HRDC domain-containing protein, partial [Chloroflexia bacterium]|nr:HRDC domain-containing protein [Chloroflexia bacterium]